MRSGCSYEECDLQNANCGIVTHVSRSDGYQDIAEHKLKGVWNVPFVASVMLVANNKVGKLSGALSHNLLVDADLNVVQFCREKGHFKFASNHEEYGYLVVNDDFKTLPGTTVNRELCDFPNNKHVRFAYRPGC